MNYKKINRNTLANFLRSRCKWFFISVGIKPEHKVTDKAGVVHTIPASVDGKGKTYYRGE